MALETSEQLDKFSKAFVTAQSHLRAARLDGKNPHFHSRFATLREVADVARDALSGQSIAVMQSPGQYDSQTKTLPITTRLVHESGQWMEGTLSLPVERPNAQGAGSAITYGRRYALAAMCGIVADDDDDGNGASTAPKTDQRPVEYRRFQGRIQSVKTQKDCQQLADEIRSSPLAVTLQEELLGALRMIYMQEFQQE